MRRLWLAAAVLASITVTATPAAAQRVWQDGRWVVMPNRSVAKPAKIRNDRWGTPVNGRWSAGNRAPGGWNSYRRLGRGAMLPPYWMGRDFRVYDYLSFGLAAPPRGYFWVRYYDDAVLADDRGQVWDSVGGIGWTGADAEGSWGYPGDYGDRGAYAGMDSYAGPDSYGAGAGYPPPGRIDPVDPDGYYDAPRHDGPRRDAPVYNNAPIPAPYQGGYPPAPVIAQPVAPPPPVQIQTYAPPVQSGAYYGGTFYGGGTGYQGAASTSYYAAGGGYAVGGAGTTTVIITPAPVTTTTTVIEEQVVEQRVVRTRAAPRKPVRRVVRKVAKPRCCPCGC